MVTAYSPFRKESRLTMPRDDGNLVLYAIDDTQLPDDVGDLLQSHRPELMRLYTNPIWWAGSAMSLAAKQVLALIV